MKQMKSVAAATFIAAALVASITGCSPKADTGAWPAEVKSNFVNACTETSGGAKEYCECSLDKLVETYPIDEYTALESKLDTDEKALEEFMSVIQPCIDELAG